MNSTFTDPALATIFPSHRFIQNRLLIGMALSWLVAWTTLAIADSPVQGGGNIPKIKVACVGDSITYGAGIENREINSYPAQLGKMLGGEWEVGNFGLNGHTLMDKGNAPYMKSTRNGYEAALAYQPDVVIIKLGTNDSKPGNWEHKADYVEDYLKMIASFRDLPSKPEVYICKPVPVFPERWGITDQVVREEIVPLVEQVGKEANVQVIDLYAALSNRGDVFPDKVHPNAAGAGLIAKAVASHIASKKKAGTVRGNDLAKSPTYHASVPAPTLTNVPYGAHQRQVLDFWKAPSASADNPAPLVVYIHGGSWKTNSKEIINGCVDVAALLKAGISVASINYRYVSHANELGIVPPVKAPLNDAARALQFVRSNAIEWDIDKARIAATGESAGGCSALWLAYHDDMADPTSADPVARESTRLFCAGVRVPQTSLDPQQMRQWMPKIGYGGHAFGKKNFQEFLDAREELLPWIEAYSPYAHVDAGDPPVSLYYNKDLEQDLHSAHSAQFALNLQKRCQEVGVFCEVLYDRAPGYTQNEATFYLIETLTAAPQKDDWRSNSESLPVFKKGARLLFIGDSITDMNRGRNERDRNHYLGHSYAFMVAGRLGIEMTEARLDFYNRGISGNTVANLKARWQKDAIEMRPDVLTILIGTNDVGKKVSPEEFEADYRAILDSSRQANPKLKIVLLDPFVLKSGGLKNDQAWKARRAATDQLRFVVARLAEEFDAVHIGMQDLFDVAARSVSPEYWMWDGIHPLPQGHELIARHWVKAVSARWPKLSARSPSAEDYPGSKWLRCATGQTGSTDRPEGIEMSVDGSVDTKWCVLHEGRPVQWQVKLERPHVVNEYQFTSANDVPARDPKEWKWEGSQDGTTWVQLDYRKDQKPFSERQQEKSFAFENSSAYRYYNLTLLTNHGDGLVQLSEIALEGVPIDPTYGIK